MIPVERLTDADRKWMLTAEYGGTGGQTIEPGMIVEEPDIEIGAGVSSKGMSLSSNLFHPVTSLLDINTFSSHSYESTYCN